MGATIIIFYTRIVPICKRGVHVFEFVKNEIGIILYGNFLLYFVVGKGIL